MISPKDLRFTVIGAGNGGLAMAGYLALKGFSVNLYNRSKGRIQELIKTPKVHISGAVEGTGTFNIVTSDLETAVKGTNIIMVTTPATGHYELARLMAPVLEDGQIIILNPGRTGGALEVYETLREQGCNKKVIVAEAQTFIYACRATGPRSVKIFSVKKEVALAAIPALYTRDIINLLSEAYPQFTPARNVIETSLNNYGAIFHPAPTLLNSGHIERGETFQYYLEGITPSIGQMLEKMDAERMRVATALGVRAISARQWLKETYGAEGDTIFEAIQNNPGYKGLTAPKGLNTRYIFEDVPCSLVPISSIASKLGIETHAIDTIIKLANMITGKNFFEEGRTVKRLGIENMTVSQILELAETGRLNVVRNDDDEVVA